MDDVQDEGGDWVSDAEKIERLERIVKEQGAKIDALEARFQELMGAVEEMSGIQGDMIAGHETVKGFMGLQMVMNAELRRNVNECRILLYLDPLPELSAGIADLPAPPPEG